MSAAAKPILLAFGPQALTFDTTALKQFITLVKSPSAAWALEALTSLEATWASYVKTHAPPKSSDGLADIQRLQKWLQGATVSSETFPLPNITLSPIVVAAQVLSYISAITAAFPELAHDQPTPSSFRARVETIGLCVGSLSALTVSSSSTLAQLKQFGSAAIHLAMLIGGEVDAGERELPAVSISASWSSSDCPEAVSATLARFHQAYVSVVMDERRMTITTARKDAAAISEQLQAARLHVSEVALRGRYHWSGNEAATERLAKFVDQTPAVALPDAAEIVLKARSASGGAYVFSGKLHQIALRAILVEQALWYPSLKTSTTALSTTSQPSVVCFGNERFVPPSLLRKLDNQLVYASGPAFTSDSNAIARLLRQASAPALQDLPDERIAVIGMACHVPGAEDPDQFWQVLQRGQSQHRPIPPERFSLDTYWRPMEPGKTWYGNFLDNYDTFDHKFFKKSPREMSSTDPQHRLAMQVAYQAVQQSGYFNTPNQDKHIACYMGVGNVDYEENIACYPGTAYSATGNLKSFLAGKISHYFGWTGPSLTLDTACSSSSVAIHYACRAIVNGDASAALAGGCNVITSPSWYHNLGSAQFLSPTGQCKPFDAKGDGYCRGEGVAAVLLKKLSAAIQDGDQIFGVIAGSRVYQNQNCTAITVPNAPSLSALFRDVVRQARLEPHQVSVVEAHGTGTAVGDPAEFEGIRSVFGLNRTDTLQLTSVKGLVGHSECASGAVSLLKILLMLNKGMIPPQASFSSLNPALNHRAEDRIEIPTVLKPWTGKDRAVLINNYGASGSNASLVVTERPQSLVDVRKADFANFRLPFWLTGADANSVKSYASRLREFLKAADPTARAHSITNLSFQLARQSNRTLPDALFFTAKDSAELDKALQLCETGSVSTVTIPTPAERPIILCFGGQVSRYIGLDKALYDNITLLRENLDVCDAVGTSLGFTSIFPDIFSRSPIEDIAKLQLMLFATQYSSAKSWIDCGISPAALVGHSFGELTALCISGAIAMPDAIEMIHSRAQIIKEKWTADTGAMMAIDAPSVKVVEALLAEVNRKSAGVPASIACFNSPRSYTIAGSKEGIDLAATLAKTDPVYASVKTKKLDVTHAFHSALVEDLKDDLQHLGKKVATREPLLNLERATEVRSNSSLTSEFLYEHLRSPVHFSHAVSRLQRDYPTAIWLEAGSNSSIINLASKHAEPATNGVFVPINITTDGAYQLLADATLRLWKEGVNVSSWAHHGKQTADYTPVVLPSYVFEKHRHWLDLKTIAQPETVAPQQEALIEAPQGFTTFLGYTDGGTRVAHFRVNLEFAELKQLIEGHVMAGAAGVWPGTFQLDVVIHALMTLDPLFQDGTYQPQMKDMEHYQPLVVGASRIVTLEAERLDLRDEVVWEWRLLSSDRSGGNSVTHTSGKIAFVHADDARRLEEFEKLERLSGRKNCLRLLQDSQVDHVLQGRNIYRAFQQVIDYKEIYQHIVRIVGRENESASRVVKSHWGKTWLDTVLGDCFGQTAGIAVNLMSEQADRSDESIYVCDGIKEWIRSPKVRKYGNLPSQWDVYAVHHRVSDKRCLSDVFAFDAQTGALIEVVLGISYQRVTLTGIRKMLHSANSSLQNGNSITTTIPDPPRFVAPAKHTANPIADVPVITNGAASLSSVPRKGRVSSKPSQSGPDVPMKTREIIELLCGVEPSEVHDDSDLVDMGLDSLMSMELIREVEKAFHFTLEISQLMDLTDFRSLVECVRQSLGLSDNATIGTSYEMPYTNGFHALEYGSNKPTNGVPSIAAIGPTPATKSHSLLDPSVVMEVFQEAKDATDDFIVNGNLGNYYDEVMPRSTELCVAHICNAFEQLGCPIRSAAPGEELKRISYLPKHEKFMNLLYDLLENDAHLIEIKDSRIIRTAVSCPAKPTTTMLQELLRDEPVHSPEHLLTQMIGEKFADCLTGKEEGIQLIFGTPEGRELATDVYAKSPINAIWITQAEHFIKQLANRLPQNAEPLRILEMGAGTGGTTVKILPMLASLNINVEYTMTDLSSSLVAAGRKRFKQYPFMKFRTLNIESEPDAEMLQSQHIILATNCVHATRNLTISTRNIRKILRDDGFLLLLEMTEQVPWVDFIFGLVEGWWLFEDERERFHALQPPSYWNKVLRSVGFGHVDWTDGRRPEARLQRLIIALASDVRYECRIDLPHPTSRPLLLTDITARQAAIDFYVEKHTQDFQLRPAGQGNVRPAMSKKSVLITGATGSLGSHLVAHHTRRSDVDRVICLNRLSGGNPLARQLDALLSRGISLSSDKLAKLLVIETDTSMPFLGVSSEVYEDLCLTVAEIVHNAWPMSIKRPIKRYEAQFHVMRNLIDLARDAASTRSETIGFQFISSIGVMGYYPLWKSDSRAPEQRTRADSVLPVGYADAKLVCENMLDRTLHLHPGRFRPHAVRIAQIAGSTSSGYWNPAEHLVLLFKSARTLRALPDLTGTLSWCPVDFVAAVLGDLLCFEGKNHAIYHIENPNRQPYKNMISSFAKELEVGQNGIVPFEEWLCRVKRFPGSVIDNPARQLLDFFDAHFIRMSCGTLVLDTTKCLEHSPVLRQVGPVSDELALKYIRAWKAAGVLK